MVFRLEKNPLSSHQDLRWAYTAWWEKQTNQRMEEGQFWLTGFDWQRIQQVKINHHPAIIFNWEMLKKCKDLCEPKYNLSTPERKRQNFSKWNLIRVPEIFHSKVTDHLFKAVFVRPYEHTHLLISKHLTYPRTLRHDNKMTMIVCISGSQIWSWRSPCPTHFFCVFSALLHHLLFRKAS